LGVDTSLLQEVEDINETARKNFLQKLFENFKGKKIAVWGLSFKPNTDDIRFAPSLYILQAFLDKNLQVSVYDPVAIENVKKLFKNQLTYAKDPYEVLKEADALCILTEWNEFKQIDLKKVKGLLKNPLVFDGRNMYDPKKMAKLGFSYFGIGRNL